MNSKSKAVFICAFLVLVALTGPLLSQTPAGNAGANRLDDTTRELYEQYIARVGKIESDSVWAAIELVAARGVGSPHFRELLRRDFSTSRQKDSKGLDSHKLLALISALLEREGGMRWQHEQAKRNDFGIDGSIDRHPHLFARTSSLRENCNAVLCQLAELQASFDGVERDWDAWWQENAGSFAPRPVTLVSGRHPSQ